ncbi:hypothetical protein B7P43_G10283 [Cryptotermes secundus]|uniref:Uncharacterized protein n=1 Tax=Cryptotermes secundus TaxID=105785 RepID=A0A2J7RMU0_9NEOP|nr:hypothetical protein B7P43_G10283 [Cryptotermes secundus]
MGSNESADPDSNTQPAHTTASLSCRFEEPTSGCLRLHNGATLLSMPGHVVWQFWWIT